jgi:hypothetical protein
MRRGKTRTLGGMETLRRAGVATVLIGAFAVGFHVNAAWREAPLVTLWLFSWSIAPYIATVGLNVLTKRPLIGVLPAAVAIILDVHTLLAVQSSTSSTAVLDFFWTPVWNLVLVVPLSAGAALLLLRLHQARRVAP